MTLLEAVNAVVWADTTFKAASPGGVAVGLLPENATLPATECSIVGGPSDPTFDGPGLQVLRVQYDCYATTYAAAFAARKALTAALLGAPQQKLADGTWFQGALAISPQDFFDSAPRQFRCMAEFYLYYNDVS